MRQNENFAHYIASLAQRAVLYEVSTSPKPGLVDRFDSGAHKDMDFFTFLASSTVLYKGFYECTMEGILFNEKEYEKLLDKLRPIGIECENTMFNATEGINTHKGIIFSLGILCAVSGNLYKCTSKTSFPAKLMCEQVKKLTKNLTAKDFANIDCKKTLTHGESLYKNFGLKGIRGEVESGFKTVMKTAVPVVRAWKQKPNFTINDLFLEVLLNLMSHCEDSNVISRSGIEGLNYVKASALQFLNQGGMAQEGAEEILNSMNKDFVNRNISPGGSADLLIVTIFLVLLEGLII